MFNIFKKKKEINSNYDKFVKSAALLIHAAKIDENFTDKEELIIKKTLIEMGLNQEKLDVIYLEAEKIEKNSNQILDITKEIKKMDENFKVSIVESLWKIIYSDGTSDMYESNFMRRLTGLLYLDNKVVGDIKEKIKNKK